MSTGAPAARDVQAALDELLGWPPIARSPQLAGFLRYVVEKTLAGEAAGIKAYSVAVDVFGRPHSFDPQTDPIVRVQARRLRALLDQYYGEGDGTVGVRIALPVGRYVPTFEQVVVSRPPGGGTVVDAGLEQADRSATRPNFAFWSRLFVGAAILVAAVVALLIALWGRGTG